MQKLLTASLLLVGCAFHPVFAQQTTPAPAKASVAGPTQSSTQVPDWVAAEFSEAYGRYFPDLPDLYRYTVSQRLQNTALVNPEANAASTLAQYGALREAVYQTIYQYCHALKYGVGDNQEVDRLVYLMLYNDFHLSDLAATRLAPYISGRYRQPAPPPQYSAYQGGGQGPDKLATGPAGRSTTQQAYERITATPALVGYPGSNTRSKELGFDGWRPEGNLIVAPVDEQSGAIRFRIKINDRGEVESVTKVAGNVSPAQEKICRDTLLNTRLVKTSPDARATISFYTFRFTVR